MAERRSEKRITADPVGLNPIESNLEGIDPNIAQTTGTNIPQTTGTNIPLPPNMPISRDPWGGKCPHPEEEILLAKVVSIFKKRGLC